MSKGNEVKERIESGVVTSFFDCLTDILVKYSGGTLYKASEFNKHFSKYMVCRYLSMRKPLLYIAEYLNTVQYVLSNEQFYKMAYQLVPRQSSSYIKYIKNKKQKTNIDTNEVQEICEINSKDISNMELFEL